MRVRVAVERGGATELALAADGGHPAGPPERPHRVVDARAASERLVDHPLVGVGQPTACLVRHRPRRPCCVLDRLGVSRHAVNRPGPATRSGGRPGGGIVADVDPRYGLMADTNCDAPLPVNSITEEFTFGQFIRLTRQVGDLVAAVELTRSRRERPTLARAHPAVSFEEALGESPAELRPEDGGIALLPQGAAREVEIADLDALLATGRVALGDEGEAEVGLARAEVSALLAGRPVQLRARLAEGTDLLRLTPPRPLVRVAAGPAVEEHEVTDLAGFLARPLVPGLGGLSYPLTLTPEQVGELRRRGRTAVEVAGSGDAASVTTVQLRMRRRGGDGDGDDSGGDGDGGERPGGDGSGGSGGGSGRPSGGGAGSGAGSSGGSRTDPGPAGGSEEPDPPTPGTGQVVLFLPWRQTWLLRGYSRGPLVTTLSLGPQEETTIEVFSWDRSRRSLEQSSSTDVEQSFESSDTTKDVVDVVKDMTRNENLQLQANASLRVMYGAVDAQLSGGANRTGDGGQRREADGQPPDRGGQPGGHPGAHQPADEDHRIERGGPGGAGDPAGPQRQPVPDPGPRLLRGGREPSDHHHLRQGRRGRLRPDRPAGGDQGRRAGHGRTCGRTSGRIRLGLLDPAMAPGLAAARLLEARETAFRLVCQKAVCATASGVAPGGGGPKDDDVVPSAELVRARTALTKLQATYQALHQASADPLMEAWDDGYEPPSNTALLAFRLWLYRKLLERLLPRLRRALEQLLGRGLRGGDEAAGRRRVGERLGRDAQRQLREPTRLARQRQGRRLGGRLAGGEQVFGRLGRGQLVLEHADRLEGDRAGRRRPAGGGGRRAIGDERAGQRGAGGIGRPRGRLAGRSSRPPRLRRSTPTPTGSTSPSRCAMLPRRPSGRTRCCATSRHTTSTTSSRSSRCCRWGTRSSTSAACSCRSSCSSRRVIGAIQTGSGVLLAVPLNPALSAQAQAALDLFLLENPEVRDFAASRDVTLPTPGVTVEGRLGACSCCEPDTTERMRLELARTAADAALVAGRAAWLEQDARRYRLRLDADPPDLKDPRSFSAPELMVTVRQEPPDPDI